MLIRLIQAYEQNCLRDHDDGDNFNFHIRSTEGDQIGQDRSHQNSLGHTVSNHYSVVRVHDQE